MKGSPGTRAGRLLDPALYSTRPLLRSTRTARAARSHSTRRPCGSVRTTSRWPPFNLGNHRWSLGQWTISRQPFLLSAPNHGSVCGLKMFDTANLV
ncbi:Hypothetical protein NTJ_04405 [Nesidiocoris tenuis]|uniref:Uncharacterized protein n=1 Tax=Nesidiocoris tenuis TaxID=355587 RepID=A0ABN7AMM6_9HEMI|nr:Hypothetical protein NTJ_04405 [Nesidiocoris tenuis]